MLNEIQVSGDNCLVVYPQLKSIMDKRNIPIAPAPTKSGYQPNGSSSDLLRCRTKKITYKNANYATHQSASIIRRNARERNRVKQVNDGFAALRKHLPPAVVAALSNNAGRGASKKLSKVDTLRMVVEYIRYLQQLLDENEDGAVRVQNMEDQENYTTVMDVQPRMDSSFIAHTPPCSDTSSPAPSFSSDVSSAMSGYSMNYFPIDKYEGSTQVNPADEELLDVISWWQQK